MADSILVILSKAPYGLEDAFAGLRLALSMAVNGMKTGVVMIGDGVFNTLRDQRSEEIRMPSNKEATTDIYEFDARIFAVHEDLELRGINEDQIFDGIKIINESALREMIAEYDVVTTF